MALKTKRRKPKVIEHRIIVFEAVCEVTSIPGVPFQQYQNLFLYSTAAKRACQNIVPDVLLTWQMTEDGWYCSIDGMNFIVTKKKVW